MTFDRDRLSISISGAAQDQKKNRAIVFVIDPIFLVPAVLAAKDIAANDDVMRIADIIIYIVDLDADRITEIEDNVEDPRIEFRMLDSRSFFPDSSIFFNKTHVPPITLGRCAINAVIPSKYEHVVYIDGDVRVIGNILPLVEHDVAPGRIAAASEFLWLCEDDRGPFWEKHRAYLTAIGVADPLDYFNAGVLAFRADTWRDMAPKALEYFQANSHACIYHDQSALNAIFQGRREVLSPIYNFGTEFARLGVNDDVDPKIAHFSGGSKPWWFEDGPWGGRFIGDYKAMIADRPFLKASFAKLVAGQARKLPKKNVEDMLKVPLQSYRRLKRRRKLMAYLDRNHFVPDN